MNEICYFSGSPYLLKSYDEKVRYFENKEQEQEQKQEEEQKD